MRHAALFMIASVLVSSAAMAQSSDSTDVCLHADDEPEVQISACTEVLDAGDEQLALSAHRYRGNAYLRLEQAEQAIEDFNSGLAIRPDDARLYADRGRAHCMLGDTAATAADWLEADSLSDEDYRQRSQEFLVEQGLFDGPADGQSSLAFEDAIAAFAEGQCAD